MSIIHCCCELGLESVLGGTSWVKMAITVIIAFIQHFPFSLGTMYPIVRFYTFNIPLVKYIKYNWNTTIL